MISYASSCGGERNLGALESAGWRLLYTPFSVERPSARFKFCLDNGAWHAFKSGAAFDESAFARHLRLWGRNADFAVMPDIVAGGGASLALSLRWMRQVLDECGVGLIPVQDGMRIEDVAPLVGARVGIFVGGSTEWKLATMAQWSALAHRAGAWCHVGRVNTVRRIKMCSLAGVTSFDGTSATKFSVTVPKLTHARQQQGLFRC